MHLESTCLPLAEISPTMIREMLALMQTYYEGVVPETFVADLQAKHWVIVLHENGILRGFSTQTCSVQPVAGTPVRILFSGDTIIEPQCWSSLALPVAFVELGLGLQRDGNTAPPLYWLLTSKGYKTYRYLPVFYRDFYPRYDRPTPAREKQIIDCAALTRFGSRYDAACGCLRARPGAQRLRPGVADLDARRLSNPDIAFFQQANPGHAKGDELVCLARLARDNLTPFLLRHLAS
jgi:hypothetical protein